MTEHREKAILSEVQQKNGIPDFSYIKFYPPPGQKVLCAIIPLSKQLQRMGKKRQEMMH